LSAAQSNAQTQIKPMTIPIASQADIIVPSVAIAPADPTSLVENPTPNNELSGKFHSVRYCSSRSRALPSSPPAPKVASRSLMTSANGVTVMATTTAASAPNVSTAACLRVEANRKQKINPIASESQAVR